MYFTGDTEETVKPKLSKKELKKLKKQVAC